MKLKQWREELGLSIQELSNRLEISVEELDRLERQERISKVLELAMNWIEFEMLRPSDSELADTHRRVAETLARTEKYL